MNQFKNKKVLTAMFELISTYINESTDSSQPVIKYKSPGELLEIIDFTVRNHGISHREFTGLMDKYLQYSVKTGNKQFYNQLYSGFNFPAFIGDVLSSLANTSMYTYEVAPVATMIEKEMIKLMNGYVGYASGDGIFLSGGSNANLIAMFSARNRALPKVRKRGMDGNSKLKAFVNKQAHYSFDTAANLLGIGTENVVKVKTDNNGRMISAELEKAINLSLQQGDIPFFVGVTCATTLLGAYDPIDDIAAICQKYGIWLHADGSFGGSIVLSEKNRHLANGIEKTDSFGWTPHKLMNIPLICSALLVKRKGVLQKNIVDVNTDYIYHNPNDTEDLGEKSIQCGRHVDAVKLWFAWKYYGKEGYEQRIDNLIKQTKYCEEIIIGHPQMELLAPRQSFTICFRVIPPEGHDSNSFNLQVRETLRRKGLSLLNYGYIGEKLALRIAITNGDLERYDIDILFRNLMDTVYRLQEPKTASRCGKEAILTDLP